MNRQAVAGARNVAHGIGASCGRPQRRSRPNVHPLPLPSVTRRGALRAIGSLVAGLAAATVLGGCGDSDSGQTPEQAEAFRAYQCGNPDCGYVYDPMAGEEDRGHEAGTPFQDLPEDYTCPMCGTPKSKFTPYEPKK